TGVQFLEQAIKLYPDAKRVLLTAYADTDAAIAAINTVRIHYYLMKPWDPPDQNLYPYLGDLLDDWRASYTPPFEGIQIVGYRWQPASYALREFFGRNLIPFQWLDAQDEAKVIAALGAGASAEAEPARFPVVVFPDGTRLSDPDVHAVAERV